MEFSKNDWKLFREKLPQWQESYMERLIKEYINMLSSDEVASEKFWTLEKRIKEDKRHPGVILELRKSTMDFDLVRLIDANVITIEDISEFSDELKYDVQFILNQRSFSYAYDNE